MSQVQIIHADSGSSQGDKGFIPAEPAAKEEVSELNSGQPRDLSPELAKSSGRKKKVRRQSTRRQSHIKKVSTQNRSKEKSVSFFRQ